MTTLLPPASTARPDLGQPEQRPTSRLARLWRGPDADPRWARPGLGALVAATAVLYLWGLSRTGWGNTFYAAAVQAGTKSWKAMFFGASDAAGSITVDKPPLSLWVMELSARVFGLSSWSVLAPQAIEGVAAVALLATTVKRWFGAGAGLLAGAIMALTPVAVLMFRFDNPDALLVLVLVGAAWATTRAIDTGRTRWLVLAGTLVGLGFMTKTLQALLVVPALGLAYLWAGPPQLRRRVLQLLAAGVALAVSSLWWVVAVMAVPASARPYIGGSQDNSEWNLIFGYNGFGRLTGNETGSVGGGAATAGTTGQWGPTGWLRLFNDSFGGQASWILPAALVLLATGMVLTARRDRLDRGRAALLLWGGSMVVTGLTFSLGKGIIHPYYTVALAPEVAATVAVGGALAWRARRHLPARVALAGAVVASVVWAWFLLDRTPTFLPWLRTTQLVVGALVALGLVVWGRSATRLAVVAALSASVVALSGSAAYAADTSAHVENGAIPSAGPAGQGGPGGFGGFGRAAGRGGAARGGGGFPAGGVGAGGFPGGGFPGGGTAGGGFPAGGFPAGGFPAGSSPGGGTAGRAAGGFGGFGGGGAGGLLGGSTPSKALTTLLETNASKYTWVAATTGSEQAAGYQLATGDSVMPIGGFNGTDPSPTLAQFERWVAQGRIHYYVAGGGFGGFGRSSSTSTPATQISTWVKAHYAATTVGGVTVYDLAGPATA